MTCSTDGTARIHDAMTCLPVAATRAQPDFLHAVAWSPRGGLIATGCDTGTYTVFKARTLKPFRRWTPRIAGTKAKMIWALVFSADGKTLYSGGGDTVVHAWNPATGRERFRLVGHKSRVLGLALDGSGARLASADGDGSVAIWDLKTRKRIQRLKGHTASVYAVAWHPTRPLLASASADGSVRLWNTKTWKEHQRFGVCQGVVFGVAFSDDGKLLAISAAKGQLQVLRPVPAK